MIRNGANLYAKDTDGETPLHLAVKHGSIETAVILAENGADLHLKNNNGETSYTLSLLVEKKNGENPLGHYAEEQKAMSNLQHIVSQGVEIKNPPTENQNKDLMDKAFAVALNANYKEGKEQRKKRKEKNNSTGKSKSVKRSS